MKRPNWFPTSIGDQIVCLQTLKHLGDYTATLSLVPADVTARLLDMDNAIYALGPYRGGLADFPDGGYQRIREVLHGDAAVISACSGRGIALRRTQPQTMKTPRIVLLVLLGAGFIRAQAQDTPALAPPAAPAQTEMQKWIATTDAQWQAVFKRDVTDVHGAELNKVKLQFLTSLEDGIKKASAANDLKGALALRNEQKRFGDTQLFPEKDEPGDAAPVKAIRAAIRAQLAKLEKDNAARAKALHAKYDQLLAQAQAQLTKAERLDDALLVQTTREEVGAAWLAGIPAAPAPVAELPKPNAPTSGVPVTQTPRAPTNGPSDSRQIGTASIEGKLQNTTWLWSGKQNITFLAHGKATWTMDKRVLDWRVQSEADRTIEGHTPAGRPFTIAFDSKFQSGSLREDRSAPRETTRKSGKTR